MRLSNAINSFKYELIILPQQLEQNRQAFIARKAPIKFAIGFSASAKVRNFVTIFCTLDYITGEDSPRQQIILGPQALRR